MAPARSSRPGLGSARGLGRRHAVQRGGLRRRALPPDGRRARRRRDFELIFVDDGSTDGTFDVLERLHAGDARVRGVRFKRNFGQHPAMHAGLARARGEIVVTMDGDLQNPPEDIPKLVAAVEAGADVASGRRAARRDSWGRTLPSRLINGMLRRFTGVAISDFGCAFNAYRRDAVEPVLGAIGKQKFTKALVLSTRRERRRGGRRPRAARRRVALLAAPSDAARARTCSRASGRSRSSGSGVALGTICTLARARARRLRRSSTGSTSSNFPGPLFGGVAVAVRARRPGLHPRAGRRVPRADPAGRRGPAALHDRAGARCAKRVLVTGGAGFISRTSSATCSRRRRYEVVSLDALTYAGNLENLADVMAHPRLSFVHGDIRDARARARARRRGRRDRQRRRRVARREVDRGGRVRVRDDERRGDADPARRDPRDAGRALHPDLVQRGVRHRRVRADGRGAPAEPALARTRRRRPAPTASRTATSSPTTCRS